jgi:hypothetical protein
MNITASNGKFQYVGSPDVLALQLAQSFGTDATVKRMADGRVVVDYLTGVNPYGKSKVPKSVVTALGGKMEIFPDHSPSGLLGRFGGRGIERDGESGKLKLNDVGVLRVLRSEGVEFDVEKNGEIILRGVGGGKDVVLSSDIAEDVVAKPDVVASAPQTMMTADSVEANVVDAKTDFLEKHSDNPELIKAFMDLQKQFGEASSEFIAWYEGASEVFSNNFNILKGLAVSLPKSIRVQFKSEVLDLYRLNPDLLNYFLELKGPSPEKTFLRFMKLKDVYLKNYEYVKENVEFFINSDLLTYLASDPSRFDEVRGKYERNKGLIENFNDENFVAKDVPIDEKLDVGAYVIGLDKGVRVVKLFGQEVFSLKFREDGSVEFHEKGARSSWGSELIEGEVLYVKKK